jgi:hypothetical protein
VPVSVASGAPVPGFLKVVGSVSAAVPDGSGGWYIGGSFSKVGGVSRSNLARVLADGSVAAWNPSPDKAVYALALSGNTLYVGGEFFVIAGNVRGGVAALDATSGVVRPWHPPANTLPGVRAVHAIAVSGNTIYLGGTFTTIHGLTRNRIAAVDATTAALTDWDPDPNAGVTDLAVGNGVLYVAGGFTSIGGVTRNRIAALDFATGVPTAWNPNASHFIQQSEVKDIEVSGGIVYAAGSFSNIGGMGRYGLAALDAVTGTATGWNPGPDNFAYSLAVSGGIVYVGGDFTTIGGQPRAYAAALDAATGAATAWDPQVDGDVQAIAVSGNQIYVGGGFGSVGAVARQHLAALDATTGMLTDWNPGADGSVAAMVLNGSTLYVGGAFSTIGGQFRSRLAALDVATGTPTAWNPTPGPSWESSVAALALEGGTLYVGGVFDNVGGSLRKNLAAVDIETGAVTPFRADANQVPGMGIGWVGNIVVHGGSVFVAGSFGVIGGVGRTGVAALDPVSGAVKPWNPGPSPHNPSSVTSLVAFGGTVFVGGDFSFIGGQHRNGIAAIDAATGSATAWNPAPVGTGYTTVSALALDGGTLYAAGHFNTIGGETRPGLAALDVTSGAALPWDPNAGGLPNAGGSPWTLRLVVGGGTVYVGGEFLTMGSCARANLAAIPSGTVDVPPSVGGNPLKLAMPVPNPVRAQARIGFTLASEEVVTLAVFDVAGRRVATLLDGVRTPAGPHTVEFEANGWRAGCYSYQLTAGARRITRTMVVLR